VLYFYFNYKDTTQTISKVLSILLKQLVSPLTAIPKELKELYIDALKNGSKPSLVELKFQVFEVIKQSAIVYLIIDAFDECEEQEQEAMLDLLSELGRLPTRILVTTRPHPWKIHNLSPNAAIEMKCRDEDVQLYIQERLAKERGLSQEIKSAILMKLRSAAQGMHDQHCLLTLMSRFLLVRFQLDHILSEIEPRAIMEAINTVPSDLTAAYQDIITRIERRGKRAVEFALRVLSWIFHAPRAMAQAELCEALAVRPGDTELNKSHLLDPLRLVEVCESLVVSNETTFGFTHYTVHEFLRANNHLLLTSASLAETCLSYITFDVFQDPCFLLRGRKETFQRRIETYQFYRFAAHYWGNFASGIPENHPRLRVLVLRLLRSEGKIKSLEEVMCSDTEMLWLDWTDGLFIEGATETFLHVIARNNLSVICRLVVEKDSEGHHLPFLHGAAEPGDVVLSPEVLTESQAVLAALQSVAPRLLTSRGRAGLTAADCAAIHGNQYIAGLLGNIGAEFTGTWKLEDLELLENDMEID